MKIRIDGCSTVNKGAELMLFAILEEIERRFPDAEVYYNDTSCFESNHFKGYFKTKLKFKKPLFTNPFLCVIAKKLHILGITERIFKRDINTFLNTRISFSPDILLDASGFRFSDSFISTESKADDYIAYYQKMHNRGTKIIFLPQAFGPFENKGTKKIIEALDKFSDLIIARDKTSYHYIEDSINPKKLFLYPDFTGLVSGSAVEDFESYNNCVCIIPNLQMVRKGVTTIDTYTSFIEQVALNCTPHQVVILNHEGVGDDGLCKDLSRKLNLPYIKGYNAKQIKYLISKSYLVISSRFHGVASSLTSAVPCLSTSWSHKYKELFDDFGQKDCVLDINDINGSLSQIKAYLGIEKNNEIRENLLQNKQVNNQKVHDMWNLIWEQTIK